MIDAAVSNAAALWSSSPSPQTETKDNNNRDVVVDDDRDESGDSRIPILTMIDAASYEPIPSFSSSFGSSFDHDQKQVQNEEETSKAPVPSPSVIVSDEPQQANKNKYKDQLRKSKGKIKSGISSLKRNGNTTKSDSGEGNITVNNDNGSSTCEAHVPTKFFEPSTEPIKTNTDIADNMAAVHVSSPPTSPATSSSKRPPLDPSLSKRKTMFGSWKNKTSSGTTNKKDGVSRTKSKPPLPTPTPKVRSSEKETVAAAASSSSSSPTTKKNKSSGTKISKARVQALVHNRSGGEELRDGVPSSPPTTTKVDRTISRKQVQNTLNGPQQQQQQESSSTTKKRRSLPAFMIYRTSSGSSSVHENLIDIPSFHQSFSSASDAALVDDVLKKNDREDNLESNEMNKSTLLETRSPSLNKLINEIRKDNNITSKQDQQQRDDVGDVVAATTSSVIAKDGTTTECVMKDDDEREDDDDFAFSSDELSLSDISTSDSEDGSDSDSDDDEDEDDDDEDSSDYDDDEDDEDGDDDLEYMDSLDESDFFSDEDDIAWTTDEEGVDNGDDGVSQIDVMTGFQMMYASKLQNMKRNIDTEVEDVKQGFMNLFASSE